MNQTLEVEGLNKTYRQGGNEITAVQGISFCAGQNEVVGILGPNGSGKTTTLKAIAGLTSCAGTIRIKGLDSRTCREHALFELGAVLEGTRNIYWRLSVLENILYFAGLKGMDRQEARMAGTALIETLALGEFTHREVRKLSRGNQQKAAIACALVHRPALVLLDEPTLGLDVEIVQVMKHWLRTFVRENQSCVLVSSHDLDFVEAVCDRVIILFRGEIIAQDSVAGLRTKYRPRKRLTLKVKCMPSSKTRDALARLGHWEFRQWEDAAGLIMNNADASLLYPSLGILEKQGLPILDILVTEESLEDIFIDMTRGGRGHEPAYA